MSTARTTLNPSKKFMILDVDSCMVLHLFISGGYIYKNPHLKMLCNKLIALARSNGYSGFYVCTHRNIGGFKTRILQNYAENKSFAQDHGWELPDLSNYLLHNIVKHFKEETGLECYGVCILDDLIANRKCGDSLSVLYGLETAVAFNRDFSPPANFSLICNATPGADQFLLSKNSQLELIVNHAIEKFGKNTQLEAHFYDDRRNLCLDAANHIALHSHPNVNFLQFHHFPAELIIAQPVVSDNPDVVAIIVAKQQRLVQMAERSRELWTKAKALLFNQIRVERAETESLVTKFIPTL